MRHRPPGGLKSKTSLLDFTEILEYSSRDPFRITETISQNPSQRFHRLVVRKLAGNRGAYSAKRTAESSPRRKPTAEAVGYYLGPLVS